MESRELLKITSNKRLTHKSVKVKAVKSYSAIPQTTTSILVAVTTTLISCCNFFLTTQSASAAVGPYCQFAPEEVAQKEKLLKASLTNKQSTSEYNALVQRHREMLQLCRSQTWPEEQAIWLRLYPCDISPGSIDHVLDRIVNLGYSKIHLEVFYDSQVLYLLEIILLPGFLLCDRPKQKILISCNRRSIRLTNEV